MVNPATWGQKTNGEDTLQWFSLLDAVCAIATVVQSAPDNFWRHAAHVLRDNPVTLLAFAPMSFIRAIYRGIGMTAGVLNYVASRKDDG